jgi:tRNA G26 N,N-dimethylase Trm1
MEMILNMVEVYKTNVRHKRQARRLLDVLSKQFPMFSINFDLEDCDKILRVEGKDIPQEKIAKLVTENGYQCNVLD